MGGVALLALTTGAASAQVRVVAAGRVLRATASDTVPAASVRVVLHRVGRQEQGPVDSALTDASGHFAFRFLADTTAIYLLSARHAGIAYFATPIHTNPERPDTAIELMVADTSARARVRLDARHIVVSAPDEHGARVVVDVLVVHNDGPLARSPADSGQATWGVRIPTMAMGFAPGEGDFPPESVVRRGDSVLVLAPIAPGDKQVVLQYTLPGDAGRVVIPFDETVPLVNVMLEEKGARVEGGLSPRPDSQTIQGRGFGRWEGPMDAGSSLAIRLSAPLRPGRWTLGALVALMCAALLAGTRFALRRPTVPGEPTARQLMDAIARLDAAAARHEADAAERARYELERGELKRRLLAALANSRTGP